MESFAKWLGSHPHRYKLVTAGNHDKPIERDAGKMSALFKSHGVTLLINEGCVIGGLKFWASPVTPTFYDWYFMVERGPKIKEVWDKIPADVDVLMTHGPAYGHGDLCPPYRTSCKKVAGCLDLLNRIREVYEGSNGVHPKVHVFGHIHDGYGMTQSDTFPGMVFVNASTCTERYKPTNQPIVFEID